SALDILYQDHSEKISSTPYKPSPILVLKVPSDLSSPDTFGLGWTKVYVNGHASARFVKEQMFCSTLNPRSYHWKSLVSDLRKSHTDI
ncbi:hypothetical protein SK128_018080, partial [Halocaridina rubra]